MFRRYRDNVVSKTLTAITKQSSIPMTVSDKTTESEVERGVSEPNGRPRLVKPGRVTINH
jgi:hypothetical protein